MRPCSHSREAGFSTSELKKLDSLGRIGQVRSCLYSAARSCESRNCTRSRRLLLLNVKSIKSDAGNRASLFANMKYPAAIGRGVRSHQVTDYAGPKGPRISIIDQVHDPQHFGQGIPGACSELVNRHEQSLAQTGGSGCAELTTNLGIRGAFSSCWKPSGPHCDIWNSRQTGKIVMTKAEEYRAKAAECEERAEQSADPFIKAKLSQIAQKWREMADYEDTHTRKTGHGRPEDSADQRSNAVSLRPATSRQ
jgi:hypothetical protein